MTVNNKNALTPFYDMVCTAVYPNLSQKFAFKIGGENRPNWIMLRHWERFANDIDTKPAFVIKIIMNMMLRIEKALPVVIMEMPKVWVVGGDGGMGDIGYQNVSKVVLQNRPNVKMLMLDTQVYSNTGGQNSDSSPMPGGFDMNQIGVLASHDTIPILSLFRNCNSAS